MISFFQSILLPADRNTRPTNEQFIHALVDALAQVATSAPRGAAVLQTIAYELQDFVGHQASKVKAARTDGSTAAVVFKWQVDHNFHAESPLFKAGYNVSGRGANNQGRRKLLSSVFEMAELPGTCNDEDRTKWGTASSAQRLYAISKFIAWLRDFQGPGKPTADLRWASDLDWLKAQYYKETMSFAWPETVPKFIRTVPPRQTMNMNFSESLTPSAALAVIVGGDPLPRSEVVRRIWAYIKAHELQDAVNKRNINADANLWAVFGKGQITMFEMAGLISNHLR